MPMTARWMAPVELLSSKGEAGFGLIGIVVSLLILAMLSIGALKAFAGGAATGTGSQALVTTVAEAYDVQAQSTLASTMQNVRDGAISNGGCRHRTWREYGVQPGPSDSSSTVSGAVTDSSAPRAGGPPVRSDSGASCWQWLPSPARAGSCGSRCRPPGTGSSPTRRRVSRRPWPLRPRRSAGSPGGNRVAGGSFPITGDAGPSAGPWSATCPSRSPLRWRSTSPGSGDRSTLGFEPSRKCGARREPAVLHAHRRDHRSHSLLSGVRGLHRRWTA